MISPARPAVAGASTATDRGHSLQCRCQCRFCGFGATGLAGQWAGWLSGLQRGLTSMWLSRVNTLFSVNLNVPFASALRRRAGPPGRLQTHKFNFRVLFWAETAAGRPGGRPASGLQRGLTHCDFTVVVTSQCLFCGFGATGLAGQGAGRLSGLQRGLTSMWLSRVNIAFLNVPFASALRARRGGFTSLQTKSVHFKLCLAGIVKQGRITYSWFREC